MKRVYFSYSYALGFLLVTIPSFAIAAEDELAAQGAYQSNGFAGGIFINTICDIYGFLGGELGAFFTSVAIVTALVAAVGGGLGSLRSAIIVAVSSFAMSSGVSFYFGSFECSGNDNSASVSNQPTSSDSGSELGDMLEP